MEHIKSSSRYPILFAAISMLIGLSVLIGWAFDISILKTMLPNQLTMKVNTAIGMILCGLAIIGLSSHSRSVLLRWAITISGILILVEALLTLSEYLFQVDFGFQQLLFTDTTTLHGTNIIHEGRMSPTSAFCFLMMGIAILLSLPERKGYLKKPISAALSTTVVFISGIVFITFIPNLLFNTQLFRFSGMGFHTSLSFLLLGLSILILLKQEGHFSWTLNTSLTIGCLAWLFSLLLILSAYDKLLGQIEGEESSISVSNEVQMTTLSSQLRMLAPLGIFASIAMMTIGIFIINSNALERRRIMAKQKQLAEIVEFSDDGIIGKDLNSMVTSWNTGAERIFGYSAQEMIGQSITILIPPDRLEEEAQIISKVKQGENIDHFETVRIRKDGKPIDISVTVSPIKNEKNEIIGASKIARDITEKKHLENQLRQSQKLSAIGQLTGGVAHDFNNLLGIILGNMDLLERNLTGNEEGLKRVKNTLNAATRGADLTKRLLAFSRMQHLNPTPTVLADCINNVVEMATRILGGNIEIICKLDPSIPSAMIDATELENALLNLAINARDAMPNGGTLVFTTKLLNLDENYLSVQAGEIQPGTYAGISVTDTGEGMPPEIIEHVFEPFFTTKERGKGTGMGLAMVYGFIKQSGGVVRIYSEVHKGTTFSLYLPLANASDIKKEEGEELIAQQTFSGKALVVDDEMDLLEIASVYLNEMGFEILHATNGDRALEIIQQMPDIDLLVTDIIMPGGINGTELAKKARQLRPDMAVVLTSGFPAETLSDKSKNIEEILINKPYSRDLFASKISRAMQNATHKLAS